jgi:hypothetical protein
LARGISHKKSFEQKMSGTNKAKAKPASWKVPGSELMIGVKWYVQYKRRYQQIVRLRDDSAIYNQIRWYYLSPRWLKPGGCKCACYPKNVESYYKDSEFEDEDWSSSDEEGTVGAYDGKNKCLFYAYAKTGKKLKEGETVVPYVGPIPMEQPYEDAVTGRVLVTLDPIMHRSYDPEYDPYDWYLLPAEKAIRKRARFYERVQRRLKGEYGLTKPAPSNQFNNSHFLFAYLQRKVLAAGKVATMDTPATMRRIEQC